MSRTLFVLVPKTPSHILPGSAIVAELDDEFCRIYYEGNAFSAVNLNSIETKLSIAAGRLRERYPTTARTSCASRQLPNDYHIVGTYEHPACRLKIDPAHELRWLEWSNSAVTKPISHSFHDRTD